MSVKAIHAGVTLAHALGSTLVGFTAVDEYPWAGIGEASPVAYNEFQACAAAQANERLAALEAAAREVGVGCETVMRQTTQPWRAILDTAAEKGCDAIVMASHGRRGIGALLLGSETQHVLARATVPVIVVR